MNIDRFVSDHNLIVTSVTELRGFVQAGIGTNADKIAAAVVSMSAKIKLHLATEDSLL